MNKTIIGIGIAILALGGIIWIAQPDSQSSNVSSVKSNSSLTVEEANNYDFGTISMAAGEVKHTFKIKNTGSEPVTIGKMYTSCMCTTAVLVMDGKRFGPYGMQGHGFIPKINEEIDAGEEATVEVVLDPAAHGPAGVGRTKRSIIIENNAGKPTELIFTAMVIP